MDNMRSYIPEIQDALRKDGYPVNASSTVDEVALSLPAGNSVHTRRELWDYRTKGRATRVVVAEEFLTYQTSAYTRFEDFLGRALDALRIVNNAVGGDGLLVTRIGLRYVDLIRSIEMDWRDHLRPGLRGFESEHFDVQTCLHQTVARTSAGTLVARVHQNRQGMYLPPDLVRSGLAPAPVLEDGLSDGELLTLLDVDHFVEQEFTFDAATLEELSWRLKEISYSVIFDNMVTPEALEAWT
jgi:uncharacterized protein (TIGR04255 family)